MWRRTNRERKRTVVEKSLNHGRQVVFGQSHGHLAAVKSHTVHTSMHNTQRDNIAFSHSSHFVLTESEHVCLRFPAPLTSACAWTRSSRGCQSLTNSFLSCSERGIFQLGTLISAGKSTHVSKLKRQYFRDVSPRRYDFSIGMNPIYKSDMIYVN